jgi:hypothetical protein
MDSTARKFFLEQAITFGRSLPVKDAVVYFRGLVLSCDDSDAVCQVRKLVASLSETDRQLDLIATGQTKFKFQEAK